jgi:hypothetical protein
MPTAAITRAQVIDLLHHIKNETEARFESALTKRDDLFDDGVDTGLFEAGQIIESVIDSAIKSVEGGEHVQDS